MKWHWPMLEELATVTLNTLAGRTMRKNAALIESRETDQGSSAVTRDGHQPSVPPLQMLVCLENN